MMQLPESLVTELEGKALSELVTACNSLIDVLGALKEGFFQTSPDA